MVHIEKKGMKKMKEINKKNSDKIFENNLQNTNFASIIWQKKFIILFFQALTEPTPA